MAQPAVNDLVRMAGGQCPPKGGQLTTAAAVGNRSIIERVIDQLTAIDRRCVAHRAAVSTLSFAGGVRA